jgi:hypothetical protein
VTVEKTNVLHAILAVKTPLAAVFGFSRAIHILESPNAISLDNQTLLIGPVRQGEMNDQPSNSSEIPLEAVFTVLSDEYRRIVLTYLLQENKLVAVDELVNHLLEEPQSGDKFRQDEVRESVAIALHHIHLPMMDDVGMIEYDPEQNEVKITEIAQEIESSLEFDKFIT